MPSHQRLVQLQNHLSSPPSEDLVLTKYSSNRRIVTIAINNARHANCLSVAVLTALLSALQSINPQIKLEESLDSEDPISFAERVSKSHMPGQIPKVVIIKSEGKVFCSGHDLKELRSGEFHTIHEIFKLCNTLMLTIRRLPQIVISQVRRRLPPLHSILTGLGPRHCDRSGMPASGPSRSLCRFPRRNIFHTGSQNRRLLHHSLRIHIAFHTYPQTSPPDVAYGGTLLISKSV
jgi:hypothetical protein